MNKLKDKTGIYSIMSGESVEDVSASSGKTAGCVKWFNNKAGYGFINVTSGDHTGTDTFVHHSAIQVGREQYKYLVQGEYVHFDMCKADSGSHEWQAGNVRGLNNGKLMCETRFETRSERGNSRQHSQSQSAPNFSNPTERLERIERDNSSSQRIRYHGPGPREGEEWMLVRRRVQRTDNRRGDNRRSNSVRSPNAHPHPNSHPNLHPNLSPNPHPNDGSPTFSPP